MNRLLIKLAPLLSATTSIAAEGEDPARASTQLVDSPLSSAHLIDTALGLVIVLALVVGLAWLFRRFVQLPGTGKGMVRIEGGVSLGTRERAVLVSVDGARILLGVAPGNVRMLHVLNEVAPGREASAQPAFEQALSEQMEDAR